MLIFLLNVSSLQLSVTHKLINLIKSLHDYYLNYTRYCFLQTNNSKKKKKQLK